MKSLRNFFTILIIACLPLILTFVPMASAPPEDRSKTRLENMAFALGPETTGALVVANDVFINGIAAQSGMTVLSGSAISTGPRGHAIIHFGSRARVELRSGSEVVVMIEPAALRAKVTCSRSRISVTGGEVTVKSYEDKALKEGDDVLFDQPVEVAMNSGMSLTIDCGARASVADRSLRADGHDGSGQVGLVGLAHAALVIAKDIALGGQRFLQPPPQAADPITP